MKKEIHEKINNLNKVKVFAIPDNMKEGIRQGNEDIMNGDVYTMDDFEKKYLKQLKG